MNPMSATTLSIRIGWSVAIVFIVVALLPFAVVGESWGMIWYYVTAPLSMAVEMVFGIGSDSYLLIGLTSVACATAWAVIAYAFIRAIQR